jgi:glycosyltransferase involved in cell wall biosynthesis
MKGTLEPWVLVCGGFHLKGGMDRANAALATFLVSRGHRVHLVAHEIAPSLAAMEGVTTHFVAKPGGSFFLGYSTLHRRGRMVARAVQAKSPDARVVVNGGNCSWPDINWVHYVHHAWRPSGAGRGPWFKFRTALESWTARRSELRSLSKARVVIANSQRTRADIIDHLGIPAERVHTVYLGSNPEWQPATTRIRAQARERLGCGREGPVAAFVGGLGRDDRKGFDTTLAAWIILCADPRWDVDLIVAGGGREVETWKSRVARAGLAHRVRMLGFTERVDEVLAAADVLVSPVRYEAYGLNVHEAICCGVPAIVSACAGVAERYPAQLGGLLLRDPDDVGELVEKMRGWRQSIDALKESVKPLTAEFRSRSWETMAQEFVALAQNSLDTIK